MSFWQWISLRISQLIWKEKGNTAAIVLGPPADSVLKVEEPLPVPRAGEMANHNEMNLVEAFGEGIFKIFTPIKWVLFGVSAVFILWAIIGRRG